MEKKIINKIIETIGLISISMLSGIFIYDAILTHNAQKEIKTKTQATNIFHIKNMEYGVETASGINKYEIIDKYKYERK